MQAGMRMGDFKMETFGHAFGRGQKPHTEWRPGWQSAEQSLLHEVEKCFNAFDHWPPAREGIR